MKAAGILLCAGKGTRMNDDSINKVSFDCAGKPVVRRIVENMKAGGVDEIVVVVGHRAESVMSALDGIDGVVYAYQKEQKGTGHAALYGLKALSSMNFRGPVIISMGDKLISARVFADLLTQARDADAVLSVQPAGANHSGGRIALFEDIPCGIVEFADAALMKLADVEPQQYAQTLEDLGVNAKKAEKILDAACANPPQGTKMLNGHAFTADQLLYSRFTNAALYCFDLEKALAIISKLGDRNAQGEIYVTDSIEHFAKNGTVKLYQIPQKTDMLTFSTKPELCKVAGHFMRTASSFIESIDSGEFDEMFVRLYSTDSENQKLRYKKLLLRSIEQYGDKKVMIARAPGRVNLMGRHIDHRGGNLLVIATNKDTVAVVSPRDDDTVRLANLSEDYPSSAFSISEELGISHETEWLKYLEDAPVKERLQHSRGAWSNYVKSAVLRAQVAVGTPLRGMDCVFSGTIPVAAGLSSSSSIVVTTMEAVQALNCLNLSRQTFIDLCGEGEWFVGSRGGAGDHAAMKCGRQNRIVQLGFKPFSVGKSVSFSDKYAVIVANSGIKAKKSEGSKDVFNAKIAAYEFSFMLLQKKFPAYGFEQLRDVAKVRPYSKIYRMLRAVPEKATRTEILALLPECEARIRDIFKSHADPGTYDLRGVALFGISECARSVKCMDHLQSENYLALGKMMKISHNGDRIFDFDLSDEAMENLALRDADVAESFGAYGCSTPQIDYLSDLLNSTEGVLGSQLAGAGLGGCVVALVEKSKAQQIIDVVNSQYYDKYQIEYGANVFFASSGSSVTF